MFWAQLCRCARHGTQRSKGSEVLTRAKEAGEDTQPERLLTFLTGGSTGGCLCGPLLTAEGSFHQGHLAFPYSTLLFQSLARRTPIAKPAGVVCFQHNV